MVEAFAMIAGTALEYGDRMLACLKDRLKTCLMLNLHSSVLSMKTQHSSSVFCAFCNIMKGHIE